MSITKVRLLSLAPAIVTVAIIRLEAQPAVPSPLPVTVRGELGARLDDYLARLAGFGYAGNVLVAKDGEIIITKGYGLANRANGSPISTESPISIGSITKQFTAAAIMLLEQAGKLKVTDSIGKFFPNVPADKRGITVHHLLTHSSGLESDFGGDFEPISRDEIVRRAFASRLIGPPGAQYEYSNTGYSLLAAIVELISGTPYEQFLRDRFFLPAGMTRTGYRLASFKIDEVPYGYGPDGDARGRLAERFGADGPYWALRGNGGIHSTLGDMYRWHLALVGDRILTPASKAKMFAPQMKEGLSDSHYGYGWAIFSTPRKTRLIAHNGGDGTVSADFHRYVDENVVVYMTATNPTLPATRASYEVAKLVFGDSVAFPPRTVALDSAALAVRAGTYVVSPVGTLEVSVLPGGRLSISGSTPEAFAALNPQRTGPRIDSAKARTASLVAAQLRGDYAAVSAAFGDRFGPGGVQQQEARFWSGLKERLGEPKSSTVLGVAPAPGGGIGVVVRVDFERGPAFIRYGWGPNGLMGIMPMRQAPGVTYRPISANEFATLSFAGGVRRVRFDGDNLVVEGVRARKR